MPETSITHENFPEFKRLYQDAVSRDLQIFEFMGREVYVPYAAYVVEYFEDNTVVH